MGSPGFRPRLVGCHTGAVSDREACSGWAQAAEETPVTGVLFSDMEFGNLVASPGMCRLGPIRLQELGSSAGLGRTCRHNCRWSLAQPFPT